MGVLIGAPLMTLGLARMPRRAQLVGLMAVFTVGNLLAALSGSRRFRSLAPRWPVPVWSFWS